MNGVDTREELDTKFRKYWLNVIKNMIHGLAGKSNNPAIIESINKSATKFEAFAYSKATNKQDYVDIIKQKLANKPEKISSPSITGTHINFGEQNLSAISSQQQPSWMLKPAPLSTMQQFLPQNNGQFRQPNVHSGQHNGQFRQQNVQFGQQNVQFGYQNEQSGEQNLQFGQQNVHFGQQNGQLGNRNGQFGQQNDQIQLLNFQASQPPVNPLVNLQASQTQYSRPLVNPQGQGNQFQDSRVHVSEMSTSYFRPQHVSGENRHIPQSNLPSTRDGQALLSSSNAGATNSDQFHLLIVEFQRASSSYVPELENWYKMFRTKFDRAQTDSARDKYTKLCTRFQNMILFLKLSENQLRLLGEEELRQRLKSVLESYNQMANLFHGKQVHQLPSRQTPACTNVAQNPQTIPPATNQPLVSSSAINPGFLNSNSSPASSLVHGSSDYNPGLILKNDQRTARPPETLRSVNLPEKRKHPMNSNSVPLTNNTTSNQPEEEKNFTAFMSKLATNASANLPEKPKDPIDPTSKPSTSNATSKRSSKPSKPRAKPSDSSHDSWLNLASKRSKSRPLPSKLSKSTLANDEQKKDTPSISQSRTSILSVATPSTPITPCSVPNGNGVETETIKEELNFQEQPELADPTPLLGSPETLLVSPLVSECTGPESIQQPPEKLPIDRLLDAVKSASKENLASAVNDMRSAVIEMDELPGYAYLDDDYDNVADFIESLRSGFVNEEHEQPHKKLKRDIESASINTSFPPNNDDFTYSKQSSELEPNQTLVDEVNDTNEKLYWTVISGVTNSSNQSNGTVVRCTYRPVGVRPDMLRSMFAVESINLSIDILVPVDYPSSPPKILDCKLPAFGVGVEMAVQTKSLFDTQVRSVEPLRVGKMGEVWDLCARSVFVAYAKHCGTETLIAEYGTSWA